MPIEYRGIEDIRIAVQAWDHDVRILHIPLETRVLSLGLGNEGHLMGLRNLLFQRHSMCFLLVFRFQRAVKMVGSATLSLLSQYLLRKERVMGRLVIAVHLGAGRYGKQLRERFFSCVLLLL